MTKALEMLVRLRETELDSIRREVGVLNRQVEAIDDKKASLSKQLVNEQVYMTRLEGISTYGTFADSVQTWQQSLDVDRKTVDQKIDSKMVQVRSAFEALKTAQVALDNWRAGERKKRERREQEMLDETALRQFIQRSETQ